MWKMDGKNDTENSRSDQFLCVAVGVLEGQKMGRGDRHSREVEKG